MFFLLFLNSPLYLQAHPSADRRETSTHYRYLAEFYNASPKIRGALPEITFWAKTCKIWGDFTQLPTLIANISGKTEDIQNQKAN